MRTREKWSGIGQGMASAHPKNNDSLFKKDGSVAVRSFLEVFYNVEERT